MKAKTSTRMQLSFRIELYHSIITGWMLSILVGAIMEKLHAETSESLSLQLCHTGTDEMSLVTSPLYVCSGCDFANRGVVAKLPISMPSKTCHKLDCQA